MIMGLLAVASLLIIFKDGVFSIVDKIIIPISSSVRQDSCAILVFAILFVVFAYLANGLLLYRKNYVKHPDHTFCLVSVAAIFYSLFRFGDHYVFYGVGHITYVDGVFATIAIMEVLSYIFPSKRIDVSKVTEKTNGFVSDSPSKIDLLGREDYAELLIDKIIATHKKGILKEGSMTILLNERYGAGKTTFFNLLEGKAKGKVRTCVFKPWITADGERITEELLHLLEEQYAISNQLTKQLEGYAKLLSGREAKNTLDFVTHLLHGRNSLGQRYESIKGMLQVINDPLVVLVDDVDRLQSDELISLLKLLRNAADFPNIIYLVAADKEAMSQMLEARGIKDADEYLKKFFSFELLFPIDDSFNSLLLKEQIVKTLNIFYGESFSVSSIEKGFLSAQYIQTIFFSPRDIYRYINLLTYTLDLFKRYGVLAEVYLPDLLKLLLIQFVSPMVYKILRDEMDLLLNVRNYDGRIHLKEGYKDIIISRQFKRQLQEVIELAKQRNNEKQEKTNDNTDEFDELTLFGIPAQERPNKEDIVSELLRDLFYDTHNFQIKSRICYLGEYFKFFAGKYSKSELSAQYMKGLMELSSESEFEESVYQTVKQGKAEFLIHKLKQYIEDESITKDIPSVLKRCVTIEDVVYRDWAQRQELANNPIDYYQIGQFRPVYSNLLLVNYGDVITEKREIEKIKAFYAENTHYAWLASSLILPISDDRNRSFVYGQKLHLELREGLIRRFIDEEMADKPFAQEKIAAIPMLRNMYQVYWEERFKEYVRNCPEPMAWLYILLKPSGDSLAWNYNVYSNLVGDGVLDSYAKDSLGLELSQELRQDLTQISGMHYGASLTATNFEHYPFLVSAKKWWDNKSQRN